ncbi:hypothetical protein L1987_58330 [Smallanthus sonchifolius]|uniref:Uncharacterized protein n=1 Tax=Smallanthus sonchifolius TaxID=185202 RepID=A0ACB9DF85_9ASTR|nr:hypothetical protein L1987_58330 [Smallanthus sonchifolius]
MNLQTLSNVELGEGVHNFQKCFPYIKELTCITYLDEENDFKSLTYLEKLSLNGCVKKHITFPTTLKTLTLRNCGLPWREMSIIQSLPNLHVLKLKENAFEGSCWNTYEQEFQQLKFLRLESLNINLWEAYSASFPCLRQLEIIHCHDLDETPLEMGYIPMLELIKIKRCWHSVGESVRKIQEEQRDEGNYDLKIDISDHFLDKPPPQQRRRLHHRLHPTTTLLLRCRRHHSQGKGRRIEEGGCDISYCLELEIKWQIFFLLLALSTCRFILNSFYNSSSGHVTAQLLLWSSWPSLRRRPT